MANQILSPETHDTIRRGRAQGPLFFLPPGQLPRPAYESVKRALTAAGAKWSTPKQAFVFPGDASGRIDAMLSSGESVDLKKKFQAFYTPPETAQLLAEIGQVAGCTVLEPSAGEGALADACRAEGGRIALCIDINPEATAVLVGKGYITQTCDFLSVRPNPVYERVIMNPPFTRNQDTQHVAHASRFLAPGGILVAIMAGNIGRAPFQKLVAGRDHDLLSLEAGTFRESGTDVRSVVLTLRA